MAAWKAEVAREVEIAPRKKIPDAEDLADIGRSDTEYLAIMNIDTSIGKV